MLHFLTENVVSKISLPRFTVGRRKFKSESR